jgi:capsular exopolysaccharide synthesis family protein
MELRDYVAIVRSRKGLIGLTVLIAVASALIASFLQTPVYEGHARVLLQPSSTQSLFDSGGGGNVDPAFVSTEIQVIKSSPVRAAVRKELGRAPNVTASQVGDTRVVEVRAISSRPKQAAIVTNAYARSYVDFRRKQAVDELLSAGKEIQAKIAELQRPIDDLQAQISASPSRNDDSARSRRDSLVQQQGLFKQKLDELQVEAAFKRTGGAQIVSLASVPSSPARPRPVRNGLLALALGPIFGTALALVLNHFDDSLKTKEDLERSAHDVPVLGLIPAVPGWKNGAETQVVSLTAPSSPAAEAYRTVRTSIQFLAFYRSLRLIQVTSPSASEGKTTTVANIAVALARSGQSVIVVSCDLRRPRLHEFFSLPNRVGFTSVLLGQATLPSALRDVPGQERLRLLPSGPLPPNPSELLASTRTAELLAALQTQADMVILDCPPVLPVTDSAVLSASVDGTLMVVTAGLTSGKQVARAVELLRQVDAPLLGTIFNGVSPDGAYGYAYQYHPYGDGNGTEPLKPTPEPVNPSSQAPR